MVMPQSIPCWIVLSVMVLLAACASPGKAPEDSSDGATPISGTLTSLAELEVRNEYLVQIKPDTPLSALAIQWAPLQVSIRFLGPKWTGVIVVNVSAPLSREETMQRLAAADEVLAVEPNRLLQPMNNR